MSFIYLGNLSVTDIEKEHGFDFTDEERSFLRETHHQNAHFEDGDAGWHMFDLPPFLSFSKGSVGHKVLDIFMAHNGDFKFQFQAGYANAREDA